jgi:hypothetical protein
MPLPRETDFILALYIVQLARQIYAQRWSHNYETRYFLLNLLHLHKGL